MNIGVVGPLFVVACILICCVVLGHKAVYGTQPHWGDSFIMSLNEETGAAPTRLRGIRDFPLPGRSSSVPAPRRLEEC